MSSGNERATRRNLLASAITLFARHGIHGLSMRELAAHAGAKNTAAVHYHFKDRDGLLLAVVAELARAMGEAPSKQQLLLAGIGRDGLPSPLDQFLCETFGSILTLPARQPSWGWDGLKLIARIMIGDAEGLTTRFRTDTITDLDELIEDFRPMWPDVQRKLLSERIVCAVVGIVCNMSTLRTLDPSIKPDDPRIMEVARSCTRALTEGGFQQ